MTWIRFLIFGCLLLSLPVFTQGQKPRDISKVKTQFLKYHTSRYPFGYIIPFKKIEIIDYRFDTTKIGYATYGNRENHTKLVARGGVQYFLTQRLNEYFKDNLDRASSKTLVIILKKMWLEYGSINQMLLSKDLDYSSILNLVNLNSVCLSDMDVFVKSDTVYQALVRLTHNFVIDNIDKNRDFHLLLMPFDSLVVSIQLMDVTAALVNKKKFSGDDIHTNYKKRFDIPVLSSELITKGIFLSFIDFKNNKPSYPDFKYKIFKLSTEVTILQNGKEVAFTDYWGFSDRKDLYVKPRFLSFRVMREGNTFDMLGSMEGKNIPVIIPLPGGGSITTSMSYVFLYPLQIDMETGKVY
jgi:hypothetical protein